MLSLVHTPHQMRVPLINIGWLNMKQLNLDFDKIFYIGNRLNMIYENVPIFRTKWRDFSIDWNGSERLL